MAAQVHAGRRLAVVVAAGAVAPAADAGVEARALVVADRVAAHRVLVAAMAAAARALPGAIDRAAVMAVAARRRATARGAISSRT